ncbi:DUF3800 domain-containing protein [Kocuria salina]|uniref:DUF3800 domain-containing protein n=1 Tax=Kocuria salina TaxID=1929416 RepID=UPI0015949F06|nr:DUF3800 domain-containing protein [Kocuria salina]NVC25308.1 DUF3800 domain-containing protein [Kocuria salina]
MAKQLFLPRAHPTSLAFLDETGTISRDRFFAVGLLIHPEPSRLLRSIQKYRDRTHFYSEFHLTELTRDALDTYKGFVDTILADDEFRFFCFIADRDVADPVARFGDPWTAYLKLSEQLLVGVIKPGEITTVLADNYSAPDHVLFEEDLKSNVNRRLHRLGIASVARMDSRATDGLQAVDVLTSAVAFHHRRQAGLAGHRSPKALLADHVADGFGVPDFLTARKTEYLGLKMYNHASQPVVATSGNGE